VAYPDPNGPLDDATAEPEPPDLPLVLHDGLNTPSSKSARRSRCVDWARERAERGVRGRGDRVEGEGSDGRGVDAGGTWADGGVRAAWGVPSRGFLDGRGVAEGDTPPAPPRDQEKKSPPPPPPSMDVVLRVVVPHDRLYLPRRGRKSAVMAPTTSGVRRWWSGCALG